uniref:LITAF domain-containing protein n=1 Tax=Strongyloides stercoralis TaxID=6248 RepID=A0A0K0ED02_STRER
MNSQPLISRVPYEEKNNEPIIVYKHSEYGMQLKNIILLTIFGGFFMSCALICICFSVIICIGIIKSSCCGPIINDNISSNKNEDDDDDSEHYSSRKSKLKQKY